MKLSDIVSNYAANLSPTGAMGTKVLWPSLSFSFASLQTMH